MWIPTGRELLDPLMKEFDRVFVNEIRRERWHLSVVVAHRHTFQED